MLSLYTDRTKIMSVNTHNILLLNDTVRKNKFELFLIIGLVILLPWQSITVGGINIGLSDSIVALTGILTLFGGIHLGMLPSFTRGFFLFLFAIISSILFHILVPSNMFILSQGILELIKTLASGAYFVTMIILLQRRPEHRIHTFAYLFAFTGTLVALVTTIRVFDGVYRVTGTFNNPNLYADYLVFTIFMILLLVDENLLQERRKRSWPLLLLIVPVLISLLGTQSRSGIGALLLGLVVLIVLKVDLVRSLLSIRRTIVSIGISVISSIFLLRLLNLGIVNRFTSLTSGSRTGGRFERWSQSILVLIDAPVFGVGWGQHPQYIDSTANLHNTVAQIFVESGLLGGIIFLVFIISVFRRGVQLTLKGEYSYTAYFVSFFVASAGNSIFHNTLNFRTFWIVLGLIGGVELAFYRDATE